MKAKYFFFTFLLTILAAAGVRAQATAYASIFAEVVAPAVVEKSADLTFNTSHISSGAVNSSPDAVTINPGSTSSSANCTMASFTVSGSALTTYDVSLPKESLSIGAGLSVSDFASKSVVSPSESYKSTVNIGATLHLGADRKTGNLAMGQFPVTLNYN